MEEARDALKALGYTDAELDRVHLKMKQEGTDTGPVDVLMKKALGLLYTAK